MEQAAQALRGLIPDIQEQAREPEKTPEKEFHVGDLVWWDGTDGIDPDEAGEVLEEEPRFTTLKEANNQDDEEWDFMLADGTAWVIKAAAIRHLTPAEWTVTLPDGERVRFYEDESGRICYTTRERGYNRVATYRKDRPGGMMILANAPVMPWSMVKRLYGSINNVPRPK